MLKATYTGQHAILELAFINRPLVLTLNPEPLPWVCLPYVECKLSQSKCTT